MDPLSGHVHDNLDVIGGTTSEESGDDVPHVQFIPNAARHFVQSGGVEFLTDEPFEILPQTAADAGLDIARKLHAFYGIPGINVEFGWLKDRLLIPTP